MTGDKSRLLRWNPGKCAIQSFWIRFCSIFQRRGFFRAFSLRLTFQIHVVQWYGASNLLDSHQNAPVHVVVLPCPQKSCVIAVSRFDANKIFNVGLDYGAQMMATYVMHFLAILSRSGSTRPPMIGQHPLQACKVFLRQAGFSAASLVFTMSRLEVDKLFHVICSI